MRESHADDPYLRSIDEVLRGARKRKKLQEIKES